MGYPSATTDAAPRASLLQQTASLCDTLSDVESRLVEIYGTLYGSEPRAAELKGAPEATGNVARNVQACEAALERVLNAIGRIENRL
jgi:hypothetical protein